MALIMSKESLFKNEFPLHEDWKLVAQTLVCFPELDPEGIYEECANKIWSAFNEERLAIGSVFLVMGHICKVQDITDGYGKEFVVWYKLFRVSKHEWEQ